MYEKHDKSLHIMQRICSFSGFASMAQEKHSVCWTGSECSTVFCQDFTQFVDQVRKEWQFLLLYTSITSDRIAQKVLFKLHSRLIKI